MLSCLPREHLAAKKRKLSGVKPGKKGSPKPFWEFFFSGGPGELHNPGQFKLGYAAPAGGLEHPEVKSSIPGLSEEPNHCALSAFRTYLLLSYLALILLLTAGVLAIAGHFVGLLLGLSLETAEDGREPHHRRQCAGI